MSFDIGFDTVGNATVIVHDGAPVLATDPWIVGSAYFGSWAWRTRSPRSRSTRSGAARTSGSHTATPTT